MSTKTLYIARHAKSSWDDPTLSDFDRPLNARGMRDAPRMAKLLAEENVAPQIIVSSPAKRARTTAEIYQEDIGGELVFDERIYEASEMTLRYLVDEYLDKYDAVMIVGHNPGLTALADRLSDADIYNLPTASIIGIEFDSNDRSEGKAVFYEYPKKYQKSF